MGSQLFCELVPTASLCLWFQINGVACLGGVPPAKGAGRGTFRSSEWLRSTSQHDSAPFTLNGVTHGNQACSHYTKRRADNVKYRRMLKTIKRFNSDRFITVPCIADPVQSMKNLQFPSPTKRQAVSLAPHSRSGRGHAIASQTQSATEVAPVAVLSSHTLAAIVIVTAVSKKGHSQLPAVYRLVRFFQSFQI